MFPALEIVTPVEPYPPPTVRTSTFAVARGASNEVAFGRETVEFLMVAVPELLAPIVRVVAAPKALTVVAVELNIEAVVVVVVISALVAPLTARSPPTVVRPDPRNE